MNNSGPVIRHRTVPAHAESARNKPKHIDSVVGGFDFRFFSVPAAAASVPSKPLAMMAVHWRREIAR